MKLQVLYTVCLMSCKRCKWR